MLLGCAVGAFFAGRLADHYGRRVVLIMAAVFFLVSASGLRDRHRITGIRACIACSVVSRSVRPA
jgi:MFS family permease